MTNKLKTKKFINVQFVSGDKIGFKISKKRVEDMGFKINSSD